MNDGISTIIELFHRSCLDVHEHLIHPFNIRNWALDWSTFDHYNETFFHRKIVYLAALGSIQIGTALLQGANSV